MIVNCCCIQRGIRQSIVVIISIIIVINIDIIINYGQNSNSKYTYYTGTSISALLRQNHGRWCVGFFRAHDINNTGIDYAGYRAVIGRLLQMLWIKKTYSCIWLIHVVYIFVKITTDLFIDYVLLLICQISLRAVWKYSIMLRFIPSRWNGADWLY